MSELNSSNPHRFIAIRYWEARRIRYNVALIPPTVLGYVSATLLPMAVGDRSQLGLLEVAVLFLVSAIGANLCFTMAYAVEFLWGSHEPTSLWIRSRRRWVFVGGTLFAMVLALVGGRNIGLLQLVGLRF